MPISFQSKPIAEGIACGIGAAVFWSAGFVTARHGIDVGFTPGDLTVQRFLWSGIALLPLMFHRLGDLDGVGWGRGIALAIFGGPGLSLLSYSGFLLVPLGHGGVIQPSCAALFGLLLAVVVLKEHLPLHRALGALTMIGGLAVIGAEAIATIGAHGLLGDFTFALAGAFFGVFGTMLRQWRIPALRAAAAVSVVSLAGVPLYLMLFGGVGRMLSFGLWENLLQVVMQGILAGPGAIYLFARSVILLGAARAAVFPSLVPGFTLLIGYLALGEVPTVLQLIGFAIVLAGFRLTQKP